VAEAVVTADGDQRNVGLHGGKEGARRGPARAVVPDLQQIAAYVDVVRQQERFRWSEHVEHDTVVRLPAHPRARDAHRYVAFAGRRETIDIRPSAVLLTAIGNRVDPQRAHDRGTSADVIP
jgi:hypothetical protein